MMCDVCVCASNLSEITNLKHIVGRILIHGLLTIQLHVRWLSLSLSLSLWVAVLGFIVLFIDSVASFAFLHESFPLSPQTPI